VNLGTWQRVDDVTTMSLKYGTWTQGQICVVLLNESEC